MNDSTLRRKVERALPDSGLPWQRRYVLLVMWTIADPETGQIKDPKSYPYLSEKTGMSERALGGHIRELAKGGWLVMTPAPVRDQITRKLANHYRLTLAADARQQMPGWQQMPGKTEHKDESPRVSAVHKDRQQMPANVLVPSTRGTSPKTGHSTVKKNTNASPKATLPDGWTTDSEANWYHCGQISTLRYGEAQTNTCEKCGTVKTTPYSAETQAEVDRYNARLRT